MREMVSTFVMYSERSDCLLFYAVDTFARGCFIHHDHERAASCRLHEPLFYAASEDPSEFVFHQTFELVTICGDIVRDLYSNLSGLEA
jgi:hypothetical protein